MRATQLTERDRDRANGMRKLINATRSAYGLPALVLDERLCLAARGHALDMAGRRYQSHVSPEGVGVCERVNAAGVFWRTVAENIVGSPTREYGYVIETGCPSLEDGHAVLLSSPRHRANILGDFDQVGIGVAENPDGTYIVVQVFVESLV